MRDDLREQLVQLYVRVRRLRTTWWHRSKHPLRLPGPGAGWFSASTRREQIYLCCGGLWVQREGTKAFSPREGAAPTLFLYGHTPTPRNKQILLFTTTHLAETKVCSRWGSLAVPDDVGDVAFSCATGFHERRGSLYSTGEGAVTMKGHGCFGLLCFCQEVGCNKIPTLCHLQAHLSVPTFLTCPEDSCQFVVRQLKCSCWNVQVQPAVPS